MQAISLSRGPGHSEATYQRFELGRVCAGVALTGSASAALLLASLHVLSPEFEPSWRMVSEYAYGSYGPVLSLMFLAWGISSCALAAALWTQAKSTAGRIGLCFLIIAGIGEAMAGAFDITHDVGHGIAGILGMGGFPIAAVSLSMTVGRGNALLLWIAHLNWISIVVLIASLALMTVQFMQIYGGDLPSQAPTALPSGVIGVDGYANRFNILLSLLWIGLAARYAASARSNT